MTNEIAIRSMEDAGNLAKALAASGFYKDATTASQALVKIMAGIELGITPIAAMTGIHIVEGKATLGSGLVTAQIQRSGKYRTRIIEYSDKAAKVLFQELEKGEWVDLNPVSEFTWADAERAGLTSKNNWKKYPAAMLFARAITQGARLHTASIFGGPVYTPDELGDDDPAKTIDVPFEEIAKSKPKEAKQPDPKPKTPPTPPAEPKAPELPSAETMRKVQDLSESLALTNQERNDLRKVAGNWDKVKAEKGLAALEKKVEERKAAGRQQGQSEFLAAILDTHTPEYFSPNEVMNIMSDLNAADSFAQGESIIAWVVKESAKRVEKKKEATAKKTKPVSQPEPVEAVVVDEEKMPF